jgi:RNA polymerase sigma factor (sigma-70 family)
VPDDRQACLGEGGTDVVDAEDPFGSVTDLVSAARRGEASAWNRLVERYLPLVQAVIRRYRLNEQDAADVNQTLWLRLVEHLGDIREPRAVPMWIVTTTRHECLRVLRASRYTTPYDALSAAELADEADGTQVDEELLRLERHQVLREAFAQLEPRCQALLRMLVADPPLPYAEIAGRLDMPVGSIGPTRARCLGKLRECPAMAAFLASVQET